MKNWNVSNRAERFIDKNADRPEVAPKHQSTEEIIQHFNKGISLM